MGDESPTARSASDYWVLQPVVRGGMLLAPLVRPGEDQSWTLGQRFQDRPIEPLVAKIRPGYEGAEPRPFLGVPPVMSAQMAQVLLGAGVGNLDLYDLVLRSADGSIALGGYKAFNLIGLIQAADLAGTRFSPENPSRHLDASIDALSISKPAAAGQLMFRLAEQTSAIIVHDRVRAAVEAAGIQHVTFVAPSQYIG